MFYFCKIIKNLDILFFPEEKNPFFVQNSQVELVINKATRNKIVRRIKRKRQRIVFGQIFNFSHFLHNLLFLRNLLFFDYFGMDSSSVFSAMNLVFFKVTFAIFPRPLFIPGIRIK